jgi:hypothetical protein
MNATEFPLLNSCIDYHSFFQDEIVFFYFNLTRIQNYSEFTSFSNRYDNVLRIIKQQLKVDRDSTLPYLTQLYKLIANTRDIHHGKGEHDISYMMIWKLSRYFPTLAIYMIHRFVQTTDNQYYVYGSWRDIKYLCAFVKQHSRFQENDSLIQVCVELINTQLKHDLDTWRCSMNSMDRRFISNIAKWIPRENKQFGWLFDLLAKHWGTTHYPYIMDSTIDFASKLKASNKYKQLYRKNVSYLNKALDTIEIKLCSDRRNLIEPQNITLCSIAKYKNVAFYDSDDDDKIKCSRQITDYLQKKYSILVQPEKGYYKYNTSSSLPINYYVKQAILFIEKYGGCENSLFHILNKQWGYLSTLLTESFISDMVPIIDISSTMRKYGDDPLYAAIGYAILISQHSFIKNRVLAVDNIPIWIHFDDNMTFIHKVKRVIETISSLYSTRSSYIDAFHLIGKSIVQTSMTPNDIQNIQFVVFSTFTEQPDNNESTLYDNLIQTLSYYTEYIPHIAFWNLSNYDNTVLPCKVNQRKIKLLSGYSPHLVYHIHNYTQSCVYTPYTVIQRILAGYQYQVLNDYIMSCVTKF